MLRAGPFDPEPRARRDDGDRHHRAPQRGGDDARRAGERSQPNAGYRPARSGQRLRPDRHTDPLDRRLRLDPRRIVGVIKPVAKAIEGAVEGGAKGSPKASPASSTTRRHQGDRARRAGCARPGIRHRRLDRADRVATLPHRHHPRGRDHPDGHPHLHQPLSRPEPPAAVHPDLPPLRGDHLRTRGEAGRVAPGRARHERGQAEGRAGTAQPGRVHHGDAVAGRRLQKPLAKMLSSTRNAASSAADVTSSLLWSDSTTREDSLLVPLAPTVNAAGHSA